MWNSRNGGQLWARIESIRSRMCASGLHSAEVVQLLGLYMIIHLQTGITFESESRSTTCGFNYLILHVDNKNTKWCSMRGF